MWLVHDNFVKDIQEQQSQLRTVYPLSTKEGHYTADLD